VIVLGACGKTDREKTVIRFWQFWDVGIIEPIVKDFEALHPGIKVEVEQLTWKSGLEKIQAAVASGTQPDLCELGSTWLPRFSYEGLLEDVTDAYHARADSFIMWESARWKGRVYGLPWVQGSRVVFYNRQLFSRAGLDPDNPPRTWNELMDTARKISALGKNIKGFGLNVGERYILYKKFMAFAWGNGGGILDGDMRQSIFNSEANLEALKFYCELARYSLLEKQEVLDHYFKSGMLGMQISGAWNLKNYALEAPQLDFDVALVPKPSYASGSHSSFAGAEMLVVFKNSKMQTQSLELAEFLQDYPQAKRLSLAVGSVFPTAKQAIRDSTFIKNKRLNVFIQQGFTSSTPPAHPGWLEMEDAINDALENVLYGRISPEEALLQADRQIQSVVDKFSASN
jgi:multiple sugar transport system substrate-binding protein